MEEIWKAVLGYSKYTDEFKQRAILLADTIGFRKASKELKVGTTSICQWKKALKKQKHAKGKN